MKYLFILMLFVFLYACNKNKTPTPANTVPDSLHKFTGTYKLFDSTFTTQSTAGPQGGGSSTQRYTINTDIVVTLDSFKKELTYNYYVYKADSSFSYFTCFTYSNDPFFRHVLRIDEDSIFINHWDTRSGHVQVYSNIKGYRIK